MPFLMQLQGPGVGALKTGRLRFPRRQLYGVGDVVGAHPLATIGGLLLGGYLAYRHVRPVRYFFDHVAPGASWGSQHAAHSREKALSGRRRRRR